MNPHFQIRSGQREFERGIDRHRLSAFLTRRQYGKTTEAARIAIKKMLQKHDVVFGSVKLDLGREIVRKESAALRKAISILTQTANPITFAADGKEIKEQLNPDDFAGIYESCRLELRLHHSNTEFYRTKVVALTEDAVGETGDLILDEVGRVKKFRGVWEAVKPIISSNPHFRCVLTTTPPPDDTHYSFELLAPPLNAKFETNPNGNWYRSELGIHVLRVDAWDAAADNVPLYDDDTGAEITPDESRRRDPDKDAWDRNYGVKFVIGGTSAIGLLELDTAQRRGIGQCQLFQIADDLDFENALAWLTKNLTTGKVGLGVDWASSQKEGTNPTSVTIAEQDGDNTIQRAVLIWKSNNPDVQRDRLKQIVLAIKARKEGGSARRLCQDATGQQLFCKDVQKSLSGLIPVENVIMSETVELPGYDTPVTKKTWLGDLYVSRFSDNRITAPPERYYREDHRMPKKIKGLYVCEPASDGKHGDTFDSGKLAEHALHSKTGINSMEGVTIGFTNHRAAFTPRRHTDQSQFL